MKHVINLANEFAKLGITPTEQLLDAAAAEAERQFTLKPALLSAFNLVHGATEKRRASTRKTNAPAQPENTHA